jgi:methionyl-tRNA formyltransferase
MRIVFMGTPEFAVPSLDRLVEAGYHPVAVVTAPDKPRGRGRQVKKTPVAEAAERHGVPEILKPDSLRDPQFQAAIERLEPDLMVVVAFRILPRELFEMPRRGAFNLHGSLLPRYRGAAPINRAIMAGETETGVTTFFLEDKVDTGNVILKRHMTIGPDETAGEVHDRMMELGALAVVETVQLIEAKSVVLEKQDDSKATPAPKIFPPDTFVDWDNDCERVHNHIRGLSPHPAARTFHGDTLIKILRSAHSSTLVDGKPGEVIIRDGRLFVACRRGVLELLEVQQEGRRRLPADDFLRGYTMVSGDILGNSEVSSQ